MKSEESRTLTEYIWAKLGLKVSEYREMVGIPSSTLRSQWASETGRLQVRNEVFRVFMLTRAPASVIKFDEL